MTKKEVPISVILPTFEIDKCGPALKHLFKQDYSNFEIVIINDNPKSKPSEELLKFIKEKKIRLITNEKNFGIAKSLNRGIRATKHEIIIILCTDYFPESRTWFKHSVDKLYSDKKIGEVCAAAENDDRFWKKYPFLLKLFSFRLMLKRSSGIGVSYKKEVFRNVGLFDTKTFKFAGDDGDLQYRMRKKGYTIEYIDDTILHCHCGENDKLSKILKKEYHYGMGHGARKRKYGIFKRIGLFDFEIRFLFILGIIVGFFIHPLISLFCFLPFFFGALKQTLNPFSKTKWIPGLLLYPFAGTFIFLIQTIGAIEGYFSVKQDKENKNIEFLD